MDSSGNILRTATSRVIILGASGFVGRSLVKQLDSYSIPTLPLSSADIDLTKPDSLDALSKLSKNGDSLVFAAALTPDRGRDISTMMKNLAIGEHVTKFLEQNQCNHVIYISSDAVYHDEITLVREESRCEPSTYYGLMHVVREQMLSETLSRLKIPLLILRPTLLYGPEDTHNSYGPNRFFRDAANNNKIILFGQGEEKRDHVYVEDLNRVTCNALMSKTTGLLNVATGKSTSFMEIAERVANLVSPDVSVEGLPRQNPITHRHFDTTLLMNTFHNIRFDSVSHGLRKTWDAIND